MDDLVFNINMLLVVIAIIAVFIIFVFRKKVKIAIKNNNDNNVKKYIVFAIKYCSKREKFLGVKRLREIVEDVYLNNYCMFNALSLFIACCGLMLNTIANKNTIGLVFIMFMMCILIVLKIELDYIIKKKILLKIDKEIK